MTDEYHVDLTLTNRQARIMYHALQENLQARKEPSEDDAESMTDQALLLDAIEQLEAKLDD